MVCCDCRARYAPIRHPTRPTVQRHLLRSAGIGLMAARTPGWAGERSVPLSNDRTPLTRFLAACTVASSGLEWFSRRLGSFVMAPMSFSSSGTSKKVLRVAGCLPAGLSRVWTGERVMPLPVAQGRSRRLNMTYHVVSSSLE